MKPEAAFKIWQDGTIVASTSGPREAALRAAQHYALLYSQGGLVKITERRGRRDVAVHYFARRTEELQRAKEQP